MVGAIILGLLAGGLARLIVPGDNNVEGCLPTLLLGLGGALVGWFLITKLLGMGGNDAFDLGGPSGSRSSSRASIGAGRWLVWERPITASHAWVASVAAWLSVFRGPPLPIWRCAALHLGGSTTCSRTAHSPSRTPCSASPEA